MVLFLQRHRVLNPTEGRGGEEQSELREIGWLSFLMQQFESQRSLPEHRQNSLHLPTCLPACRGLGAVEPPPKVNIQANHPVLWLTTLCTPPCALYPRLTSSPYPSDFFFMAGTISVSMSTFKSNFKVKHSLLGSWGRKAGAWRMAHHMNTKQAWALISPDPPSPNPSQQMLL